MPILLITGASRGIGAATARLAAKHGYDIAVNYVRDERAAHAVVRDIEAHGRRAVAIQGDMAKEEDVERLFATVDSSLGRLTHLVYNSGIVGKMSRIEAVETQTLRDVFDLNVLGAMMSLRAAIPRISTAHGGKGGAIVLLSSATTSLGAAGEYVWYAASKGAIDSMTIGAAREVAREGIRVNAVAPGPIDTEIHEPGRLDRILPNVPLGRIGTPQDVAEAILFLLSQAAANITATILRTAGGR